MIVASIDLWGRERWSHLAQFKEANLNKWHVIYVAFEKIYITQLWGSATKLYYDAFLPAVTNDMLC